MKSLERISGRLRGTIDLDGRYLDGCILQDVTIVFNGGRFKARRLRIIGELKVRSDVLPEKEIAAVKRSLRQRAVRHNETRESQLPSLIDNSNNHYRGTVDIRIEGEVSGFSTLVDTNSPVDLTISGARVKR